MVLSADDKAIDRDALRLQAAALDADPALGLAFSDFDVIDDDGALMAHNRIGLPERVAGPDLFRRLLFENLIMHGGTMVPRGLFESLGGYDTRFFHGADRELWMRIAARHDAAHVRRQLWAYRLHRRNMHISFGYLDSIREAEELLDTALAYSPLRESGLRERALAHHYVTRAGMLLRSHHLRDAASDLRSALALDPRSVLDRQLAKSAVRTVFPRRS